MRGGGTSRILQHLSGKNSWLHIVDKRAQNPVSFLRDAGVRLEAIEMLESRTKLCGLDAKSSLLKRAVEANLQSWSQESEEGGEDAKEEESAAMAR